jgi:hypothetical protein
MSDWNRKPGLYDAISGALLVEEDPHPDRMQAKVDAHIYAVGAQSSYLQRWFVYGHVNR